jgi:prepilin-type N-terminal cleavage/methylation domain-containing protein
MKEKKGFTLVELLAVIAILAILVIMALPAVLKMYSKARMDTFSNEVNVILRTAKQQYLLGGGKANTWSNVEGSASKLDLTGNNSIKYYVSIDNQGHVIELYASDGTYQYASDEVVEMVDSDEVYPIADLEDEDIIYFDDLDIAYNLYTYSNDAITIGEEIPDGIETYLTPEEVMEDNDTNYFIKHIVKSDIVLQSFIGFVFDDREYYLEGANSRSYNKNVSTIKGVFGNDNCETDESNTVSCSDSDLSAQISNDGIFLGIGLDGCSISMEGESFCGEVTLQPIDIDIPIIGPLPGFGTGDQPAIMPSGGSNS